MEEAPPLGGASPPYLILDGQQRLTSLYQAFAGRGTHRYFLNLRKLVEGKDLDSAVEVHHARQAARWDSLERQANDIMLPMCRVKEFAYWQRDVLEVLAHSTNSREVQTELLKIDHEHIGPLGLYQFPVVTLPAQTPTEAVCTIFETLNRTGVKLSVFELITARAFAQQVKLRSMWDETCQLHPILVDFGIDPLYVLQVVALWSKKRTTRSALLGLTVDEILEHWSVAASALGQVLRLLREQCGVLIAKWVPYGTMLITMAAVWPVVMEVPGPEVGARASKLRRWFWCATFAGRYENSTNTATELDVPALSNWFRGGTEPPDVSGFAFEPAEWLQITPRQRARYRATMALLLRRAPLDFHDGSPITGELLASRLIDDHHIFPRKFLAGTKHAALTDSVLNHTLIGKSTNQRIGARSPRDYMSEIDALLQPGQLRRILDSHCLPPDLQGPLWSANYDAFLGWRQQRLLTELQEVTGSESIPVGDDANSDDDPQPSPPPPPQPSPPPPQPPPQPPPPPPPLHPTDHREREWASARRKDVLRMISEMLGAQPQKIGSRRNEMSVGGRAIRLGFGQGHHPGRGVRDFPPETTETFFLAVPAPASPDDVVICVLGDSELVFAGREFVELAGPPDAPEGRYLPNLFRDLRDGTFWCRRADLDLNVPVDDAVSNWPLLVGSS